MVAKPRTKPPEVRRDELMLAAEALFLEKGFAETSVDEIVRAAGVAKGTYYLHFRSKDDMLVALRERFLTLFLRRLDESIARFASDDWQGRLVGWVTAGIETYLDHYRVHDLVFHEYRPSTRHVKQANPVVEHLLALLAAGSVAGAWKVGDAYLTAVMLFNALHGVVDDAIASRETHDRGRLIREVSNLFRRAVGAGSS